MSDLERTLDFQLKALKIGGYEREYRFDPDRRYRADFAWPTRSLLVEVEGGTRQYGRHNRHEGFEKDCTKYNRAALLGWTVLRFTSSQVTRGEAASVIETYLHSSAKDGPDGEPDAA